MSGSDEGLGGVALSDLDSLDLRGWFTDEEGAWYAAAVEAAAGQVVEVGTWRGRSTSYLAPVLAGRPLRLTCVDHWSGSSDAWNAAYLTRLAAAEVDGLSVQACFERNMASLDIPVRVLAMPSLRAAEHIADGSCDLVFLDASHDESAVKADLCAWWPKVARGGRLAGHDYDPVRHPGLVGAVQAFVCALGLEFSRGPGRIFVVRTPGL